MTSVIKVTSIEGYNPTDSVIFPISPTFPTPATGDSSQLAATTAFVAAKLAGLGSSYVPVAGGGMTGSLTVRVANGFAPLRLESNDDSGAAIHFGVANAAQNVGVHGYIFYDQPNERFRFATYNSGTSAPAERMQITSSGVSVTGSVYATGEVSGYSDARIKSDVQRITHALEKVKMLNGVTFQSTLSLDGARSTGLIAQDVQAVLPEAVRVNPEDGYLTLAYGNVMGLLVEAVKELSNEVNDLKVELACLKGE